jgi:glutamate dehydrogenase
MQNHNNKLDTAIKEESQRFSIFYQWLEKHMPTPFFEEIDAENLPLITHSLMELHLQNFFTNIHVKNGAFALCLDSPDSDEKILKLHNLRGIKNYRTFTSNTPPPFPNSSACLRIAVITFTEFDGNTSSSSEVLSQAQKQEILVKLQEKNPDVTKEAFCELTKQLNSRFLRALSSSRLITALDMFFRAQSRDNCQYEVRYNEEWQKTNSPSLQIVFAWRGVSKYKFLYLIAKIIRRHNLALKRMNAIYIESLQSQNILLMSLAIHGAHGKAAWEEAKIPDFLQELVTLKYFQGMKLIENTFIDSHRLRGNIGNLVKSVAYFVHQTLIHLNVHAYSFPHIEENLCLYPELIELLMQAFEKKFHPETHDLSKYQELHRKFLQEVDRIDTGNELLDMRSQTILRQAANFVQFTLKTNFYRNNKTAHCFRLDPNYLRHTPEEIQKKFPELPYAIYFMKGCHFLGFHIRFKDLARGGLRTVTPQSKELMFSERNNVFSECYHLAYTQQKKNKDIPEGGSKGIIFLEPFTYLKEEMRILEGELKEANLAEKEIQARLSSFLSSQKLEHLHQSQRSYIESFLTLINCHAEGSLKAKDIVDYWQKPEYIYLGPDENMHNNMIEWISQRSRQSGYRPGIAFISSKPELGINHKEFGVTSLGVNVCMQEVLSYLHINPAEEIFTIKMTGGPDGDVAGNQMINLLHFYPETAKLLTTIDISGTILDPQGLDLFELQKLFIEQKPIADYPVEKLHEGGFLLDTRVKNEEQRVPFFQKKQGKIVKSLLSGHEANAILHQTVHRTKSDIFIPAGGRPKTLNEHNVKDFLIHGQPTSRAIIEGANLYLTPNARKILEEQGVLIIKDSSANKGGVVCSSFEVLCGLCLTPEEFLAEKQVIIQEILQIIRSKARAEAHILLCAHKETKAPLTELSEIISEKINGYTYEILSYLEPLVLSKDPKDPLNQALLHYVPKTLRTKYLKRVIEDIPDIHKKAIIASHLGSRVVYKRGLYWSPKITDILPIISQDPQISAADQEI